MAKMLPACMNGKRKAVRNGKIGPVARGKLRATNQVRKGKRRQ